jgi:hypothetical protein
MRETPRNRGATTRPKASVHKQRVALKPCQRVSASRPFPDRLGLSGELLHGAPINQCSE